MTTPLGTVMVVVASKTVSDHKTLEKVLGERG
jgi:hypothetical protein